MSDNPQPAPTEGGGRSQSGGRGQDGGRGRGRGSSGRTPTGGRGLVDTATSGRGGGRGGRSGGGRGEGGGRSGPSPVHQGSGVPFGHVPAYLMGSASLVEELDQRLLIVLRDGKHLIGTLCSYDQFSNLVLQDALERRMVLDKSNGDNHVTCYTDIPLGLYVVRGDSMVLSGALNPAMNQHPSMKEVSLDEFEALVEKEENEEPQEWDFDTDLIA